jgi:hypothetical protein
MVHAGRARNRAHDIGSVLIFDGWRFFQYLEGPTERVSALVDAIRVDTRHQQFTELCRLPCTIPTPFSTPGLNYALCYDDNLDRFQTCKQNECVRLLHELMPALDLTH